MRIGIGVFAVIMALSMMLPSLTYIFGNKNPEVQQKQAQEQAEAEKQKEESEQTKTESEEKNLTGVAKVDSDYKAVVEPLEAKIQQNDKDLASLLSLGENYASWASQVSAYAASDESAKAHADELYKKSLDYYDKYLAVNDSQIVKASRAMVQYSSGDQDGAKAALEQLTKDDPNFSVAWLDLGMVYESESKTDEAKKAYEKAAEVDPNDEYGVKSNANQRLVSIAAQEGDKLTDESADAVKTEDNGGANKLENDLKNGNAGQ